MAGDPGARLPIGYWLRKADAALTARTEEGQQAQGLSRLEWQVLNVFDELGTTSFDRLAETLRPFADVPTLVEAIERLVQREAVEAAGPGAPVYSLTRAGQQLHAAALESQKGVRLRAMDGISAQDYDTAVRVLQRLTKNLE